MEVEIEVEVELSAVGGVGGTIGNEISWREFRS